MRAAGPGGPGLSRRDLVTVGALLGAAILGGCRTVVVSPRKGPRLFGIRDDVTGHGYGTYLRHRAARTAGGIDFDVTTDRRVYPVAAGVVSEVVESRVSGREIVVYHGFYASRYAHLDSQLVRAGQRVSRADQIGVAGQTGIGAMIGPHLHLGFTAGETVRLADVGGGKAGYGSQVWLDPVDFAAAAAVDEAGNATLPYWRGQEADGALDREYQAHYASMADFVSGVASRMAPTPPARLDSFGDRLALVHEQAAAGALPTAVDSRGVLARIQHFFRVRPRLTAPLGGARP